MAANSGKVRGRPFKPGESGNPSGRPKIVQHLKDLARQHTEAAMKAVLDALTDENKRVRLAAAELLLAYGYGRPTQHVEASVNVIDQLTDADKRTVLEALDALATGEESASGPATTRH